MSMISKTSETRNLDPKNFVTVYYVPQHQPKCKLENVIYVELTGKKEVYLEVRELVKGFSDMVSTTPVVSELGRFFPHYIGSDAKPIGMTVITQKDALELLGRKKMTDTAWSLAESILWNINCKSFV